MESVKPIRVKVSPYDETDGCSICKREFYEKFNFCPDCGVKIDWGEGDNGGKTYSDSVH